MKGKYLILPWPIGMLLLLTTSAFCQEVLFINIQKEIRRKTAHVINRGVININEGPYHGIRLDERLEDGIVWFANVEFKNGIIEFDSRGKNIANHSFVGIAFHGTDTTTFESIYLRPFRFNDKEEPQRSRMVQYVSKPAYTWQVLRGKFPGKFENAIEPTPAPDSWVHVKVVVKDSSVSTYINGNSEPSLVVEKKGDRTTGSVGFYVADTSGGDFANLKITKIE